MDMKFKLKGDYTEIIKQAAFSQIDRALQRVGLEAERNAKLGCPKDTGRLQNSISHTNDKNTVYIGTNVEYAAYVEMGTSRQDAQPYLEPAIVNHLQEYEEMIKRELKG